MEHNNPGGRHHVHLWAATAALFVTAATAAEPPKAVAARVVSINTPGGWSLHIRDDGSANLRYGADNGNGYTAPAGTFDAEKVRKALDDVAIKDRHGNITRVERTFSVIK